MTAQTIPYAQGSFEIHTISDFRLGERRASQGFMAGQGGKFPEDSDVAVRQTPLQAIESPMATVSVSSDVENSMIFS